MSSLIPPTTPADAELRLPSLRALAAAPEARAPGQSPSALEGRAGALIDGSAARPELPLAPGAVRPLARPSAGTSAILAAVLAVGLALRLIGLDHGLWYDEIRTLVSYVRLPLGTIVQTFDSQNQHLLYSVLARLSVVAFGEHAWSLRLPAVVMGVASLWATFWFGRRVTTDRVALLAAALLAVSYHHVWFSQNARGYTGLLLWTLLGSGLFLQLLGEPAAANRRRWLWYGLVMALGHYTHGSAFFVTGAHGLIWLLLLARHRDRWRERAVWLPFAGFVAAGVITLLLYAPVLPHFARTLAANTQGGAAGLWKQPSLVHHRDAPWPGGGTSRRLRRARRWG